MRGWSGTRMPSDSTRGKSIGVGIVGARGHVGAELIRLVAMHPAFERAYVSSRELAGQRLAEHSAEYAGQLRFTAPPHEQLPGLGADAVVLALPNGKAALCVDAFDAVFPAGQGPVIVDLSADYRFDDRWYYGLPGLTRGGFAGGRPIREPGCY